MSDLLSPVLVVMENEVDAFWCFAGLMERMVSSFVFYTTFSLCVCVCETLHHKMSLNPHQFDSRDLNGDYGQFCVVSLFCENVIFSR